MYLPLCTLIEARKDNKGHPFERVIVLPYHLSYRSIYDVLPSLHKGLRDFIKMDSEIDTRVYY